MGSRYFINFIMSPKDGAKMAEEEKENTNLIIWQFYCRLGQPNSERVTIEYKSVCAQPMLNFVTIAAYDCDKTKD